MSLGTRIRERRKAVGWSQAKLSDESGISQQMLSKLERGVAFGTTEIVDLARALKVSVDWLETGEGPMLVDETTLEDREIIEEIKSFSPEERPFVRMAIKAMLPALRVQMHRQQKGHASSFSTPPLPLPPPHAR